MENIQVEKLVRRTQSSAYLHTCMSRVELLSPVFSDVLVSAGLALKDFETNINFAYMGK